FSVMRMESSAVLFHTNFDDSEGTTQLINNQVREETRGKIVDLVNELSADTTMVLVNYIYFKALWETPSIPLMTSPHDFYVDEDPVVKVPVMLQDTQHHWYLHDRYLLCSVLWMDYKGNGKMEQVEEVLTPEMLTRWRYFYRKLKLYSPKFSISGSYKLDQILPKLGITDLFSYFHKAILVVDEVGTQAAAAINGFVTFWSQDNHQALPCGDLFHQHPEHPLSGKGCQLHEAIALQGWLVCYKQEDLAWRAEFEQLWIWSGGHRSC
uniref:Serpin domain-containing protein n=1 Tax=Monodon monoceros TaxID=40151 RepID=A0A8C6BVH7_MONMO